MCFKKIRILGILLLLCFSFYATDKTANMMKMRDPIYLSILTMADDYKEEPVNAIIMDNTVIPGYVGLEVDVNSSYQNMKKSGTFQVSKMVLKEIEPSISYKDNQNYVILKGNANKKGISFIIDSDSLARYLDDLEIPYGILTTLKNNKNNYQYGTFINHDSLHYEKLERLNKKNNYHLCYSSYELDSICRKNKKIIFQASKKINSQNYVTEYYRITSGDILFLDSSLSLSYIETMITQVHFHGLQILPIQNLLSESR